MNKIINIESSPLHIETKEQLCHWKSLCYSLRNIVFKADGLFLKETYA